MGKIIISYKLNIISSQNDFNLGRFSNSLSPFMIMNTSHKEITNQTSVG